ncbi:hypothetical protein KOW79_015709 [Hemibagrus wyckioides]|uniref:Uncharacterized protein n=1 Tax=Hemibagrus wyckioides TaxID=337641 RepID=A0A9D3NF63_9TELE|nr:hypothetical protein KOW79_015709 [Hemibagrus wyckioides]
MWRSHSVLSESEPESSPEAGQQFRKLRSSSSLNSLRMSLRKRLPLKTVQPTNNVPENPNTEEFQNSKKTSAVTQIKRTAKNTIGNAYQKFQKSTQSREECLVRTPGRILEGEENEHAPASARTPKRQATTPRRTPRSTAKRNPRATGTPEPSESAVRAVKTGGTRRQLVRMAALRSPFASPNTASRRRQFDEDLDSVSKGLRKLKRLSQAFDEHQKIQVLYYNGVKPKVKLYYKIYDQKIDVFDVHVKAVNTPCVYKTEAMEHYRTVMAHSYGSGSNPSSSTGKLNRSFIRQQSRRIRNRVGSWTDSALSNLRKPT